MDNDTATDRDPAALPDPTRRLFLGRFATLAIGTALATTLPAGAALADDDWFPGRRLGRRLRAEFRRASRNSRGVFSRRGGDDDDDRGRGFARAGRRGRDDDDDDDDRDDRGGGRGGRGGGGRGGGRGGDDDGDDGGDDD